MTIFLTTIHVIVCLILVLVILLQAGRGQGLGTSFSSGNVQSLLGTRAADFLTKVTTVSAICFLLTSIGLDYLEVRKNRSLFEASKPASPVDLETLKQLAEKVKAEQPPKASETPAEAQKTAETASQNPTDKAPDTTKPS
ncbi:MAG: preprotein translocase subunit SecG [Candidatus Omnitrophica bacterium]|nr:preprotein translocase subunit SecG [Candidatus Omnitrophota bacterium]